MPTTRSSSKKPKSITGAVTATTPAGTLRRSSRILQSKTKDSLNHSSVGVRKNAHNSLDCPKSSTNAAMATLTSFPRRSQRLLQSKNHSWHHCSLGACENGHNMLCRPPNTHKAITDIATTPTTIPRRSQRLMPSKTDNLDHCFSGALKSAQNTLNRPKAVTDPDTPAPTVLRRSQRLLQSRTGTKNRCSFDGNLQQGFGLPKELSVQRLGKSISHAKLGVVAKLNFGNVRIVKCNEPIGNIGGSLEGRITRNSSASVVAQNRGGKPKLRVTDDDVGVRQGRDSMSLSSVAVNSSKSIQKDDDVSKRRVGDLEGTCCKPDSNLVSGLEKRCLRRISDCNKGVGVKRKQKESDDVVPGTVQGWTKEQEKALQKAYFAAKPTPSFWKRVAKLVPGKSAQECFDKVDSENLTPCLPQPRVRSKQKTLSPQLEISFAETELLPEPKSKRICRRKSHINQKMVRHLMRRHSHVEPDNKADLFCVLEPTVNPFPEALPASPFHSTPSGITEKGSASNWGSLSLSNQKKSKSRFNGKSGIPIASPPVLKPVKNMALHDKYVDQLHAREAKRKSASTACYRRSALAQGDPTEHLLKNRDVVRAAKETLISDARDAINKFRNSEIYLENNYDSEEVYDDEDDDDEEKNAL